MSIRYLQEGAMRLRSDMGEVEPLPVASGASDEEVTEAVLGHYRARLVETDPARQFLNRLAIDDETTERFGIGYSDRTLGLRLPGKRWKLGEELRSTLVRLGIYRESGHEHLVGCVVVPIRDCTGRVVGLCGRRIDGRGDDLFAEGMGTHWFNEESIGDGAVVASSVFDALAVIGAGHSGVVAAGQAGALTRADARDLAGRGVRSVTLLGGHDREARTRLAREGIECSAVDERLCLTDVLTRSTDRSAALDALLSSAEATGQPSADERPSSAGSEPVVSGSRAELHVEFAGRHWRARTALRASAHDSLRVALSVTEVRSGRFHLDTLDLYQARARGAYVTAAVAELHANAETLRRELAEVIFAIERAEGEDEDEPEVVMTDAERAAALEFLVDPDLLGRLRADLASLGVVGEATNLLVAYLATISRKADRPFGVVIQSSSAAGKSTLADAVARLIPPEDLVSFSAITGQALYYLGPNDLSRKVLFVSEEQGASRAAYALKLLVTEGRLAIASAGKDPETGQLRTRGYSVEGPVALLMTTTATDIDPELQNRLVVLGVDEDRAQTRAIHVAQRENATLDGLLARVRRDETVALHRNAQRLLESLPVVIPDAASIDFPDFATRHRRDQQKLISLIAAITLLHQHQRKTATVEVGGHEIAYVEASSEDVALGLALSSEVLLRGADELAPQARRLLAVMRTGSDERTAAGAKLVAFTRRELRELTGWSEHQVWVGLERLVILEYVEERRDRPGLRHTYVLVDADLAGVRGTPREARDPEVRGDFGDPAGRTDHLASCTSIDSEESPEVGADWIVGEGRRDRSVW